MLALIKKQSIGAYLLFATIILGLISLVIYLINGAVEGYFKDTTDPLVVVFSLLALLSLAGAIALAQVKAEGLLGKAKEVGVGLLKLAAVVLLIVSLVSFIGSRSEGLAYIFASDSNVLDEIQTPENMASAYTAIVGFVFYALAWLTATVASFMKVVKE